MTFTWLRVGAALGAAAIAAACQSSGGGVATVNQPDLYAELSDDDIVMAVALMQETLESGSDGASAAWDNPQTGAGGAVRPVRTFQTSAGVFCREYDERLSVGGRSATYGHVACRGDDGVWRFRDAG